MYLLLLEYTSNTTIATDVWVLMRISFGYNFRLSVCSADVTQQSSKQQEIYCVPLFAPELEDIMTVPYGSTTD